MSFFGDATDSTDRTHGTMPHLIQHLWDAYRDFLRQALQGKKDRGEPAMTVDEALRRAPASSFATFCTGYLSDNRIAEVFQVDAGCGIRLTSGLALTIAPPTAAGDGALDESDSVPIGGGRAKPWVLNLPGGP